MALTSNAASTTRPFSNSVGGMVFGTAGTNGCAVICGTVSCSNIRIRGAFGIIMRWFGGGVINNGLTYH